ncbi:MAG: hypothetical protein RLO01_12760 [Thalassobaculaceae bacterium]
MNAEFDRDTTSPSPMSHRFSTADMDRLRLAVRRISERHGMTLTMIAEACGLARGTFTNWLGGTYGGNNHRVAARVDAWIGEAYPDDAEGIEEERAGPAPDLGTIEWYDDQDAPLRRGRVVFRSLMCARHWAIVAEDEQGRVGLILRRDPEPGSTMVTVYPTQPDLGRYFAMAKLTGRDPHVGVDRVMSVLAETTLFYATGAGAYL